MDNNTNKEQWINEVLGSTQGMRRARPVRDVPGGVASRLQRPTAAVVHMPAARWAAAAVFLVMLNIGSVIYYNAHNSRAAQAPLTGENAIASEIQAATTYNY